MGSRYFQNPYTDDPSTPDVDLSGPVPQVSATAKDKINRAYLRLFGILDGKLPKIMASSDISLYTGMSGYAYLYLNLHEKGGSPESTELLKKADSLATECIKHLRKMRDATFLCGDLGPLGVAAAVKKQVEQRGFANNCYSDSAKRFLPTVLDAKSTIPNELLYGRAGYLFGLLFLNKHVEPVDKGILTDVAKSIIDAGKRPGENPPLMWDWHGKYYLGAAHGVAGILYILLQVRDLIRDEDLGLIRQTLNYLLSIRFKSGNLPSSIGSNDDRLVHWCHGAPGFVQVLLSAAHVWKDKTYLEAAEHCGEVVWQRGLLKKGYGLCHGVAGNAYTFLALYQATRRTVYLQRALHMADWCCSYPEKQEAPPDRPYSLFEGLAGTVFFLKDIQNPLEALFPGFSIEPFNQLDIT